LASPRRKPHIAPDFTWSSTPEPSAVFADLRISTVVKLARGLDVEAGDLLRGLP
jgi:hypothetical protein